VIRLFQFPPAYGLPNASPFCMKLETYLRMCALPFEVPRQADLRKAPKGKLPYIEDNGKLVADSSLAIDYLKRTYGDPLDAGLEPEQRAIALALQRLMEENLYWAAVYSRWVEPEGFDLVRRVFFDGMPAPLKWIVPHVARRMIRKQLQGHGMGRHTREEIHQIGKRDISALADFLGVKPFFMGSEPCSIDACAYAFIANLVWMPFEGPLKEHARKYPELVAYCQRMKQRFYDNPV
jgi:glutathione S-transferase